jgi:hypothetical protein
MIQVIGWTLYGAAVLMVLRNAHCSFQSHRGRMILIIGGPSTLLAILSVLAGAAPWEFVIAVAVVDLASWFLQQAGPWPLG